MASLQARRVRGHTYWYIVESRRVNGKPRPVPVAYLGKADDVLKRLTGADALRLRSRSHGAVAALWVLAKELGIPDVIDRHMLAAGRRVSGRSLAAAQPRQEPEKNHGLTVGQTLTLISIGRACHATSKSGFAQWARTTTLGELANTDVEHLTSQHFWDQMDQVPVKALAPIEREIVRHVLDQLELTVDTLLFDATNFFTFIASTNVRPTLAARGHNKQKRDDLRQVGVALLCSRQGGIPLWHQTYGGQIADAKCFADVLPLLCQRLTDLGRDLASMTLVYDKGNVSRENQKLVDTSGLHYVTSLPVATQRQLVKDANASLAPVELAEGDTVPAYRTRIKIWGTERTAIVLVSERLRQGQMRGVMQHVASTKRWLSSLANTLQRGKQKRDRARIERDIETRLKGRQRLTKLIRFQLTGSDPNLTLTFQFDIEAFDELGRSSFGRIVLITDRHEWSTAEIIRTYHAQAHIEAVFGHLKDPAHLTLRPQFHWTNQKFHGHVFTCLLGYLLARILFLRAQRAHAPYARMECLLEALTRVRQVTVARSTTGKGRLRISTQFEEIDTAVAPLLPILGVAV